MRVLKAHTAAHVSKSAAELAEHPPDAYEVLGVEHSAPTAEVKRRYWRLSLLVHPDKCEHPSAHDAFQAVSAAARALQDTGMRAAVDERREDARLRRLHAQHVADEERARQWRLALGQATAADLAGPAPATGPGGGPIRETWMTELPPERQAVVGAMPTGGFQGFNSRGKTGRGDTSEWTMTPKQRALQLEGGGSGGGEGGQPLLRLAGAPGDAAHAARTAIAVDTFNAAVRKKSLVEQHKERLAAETKAAKKAKRQKAGGDKGSDRPLGPATVGGGEDWDRSAHPWRPWDREKEMGGSGTKSADAKKIIESSQNLTSRFGGGSQQRSFL